MKTWMGLRWILSNPSASSGSSSEFMCIFPVKMSKTAIFSLDEPKSDNWTKHLSLSLSSLIFIIHAAYSDTIAITERLLF